MLWAALNEGIRAVEEHGLKGDAQRWRHLREQLRAEILAHGYDAGRGTFTPTYDNREVGASLLRLPQTGVIDPNDKRMLGTVSAIEADPRGQHRLPHRYRAASGLDGLNRAADALAAAQAR